MPGFDDRARELISGLREDTESGATALALKTLEDLAACIAATRPDANDLAHLFDELRAARPSMIVIGNSIARIESRLANEASPLAVVRQVASELENASAAIARHASRQIPADAVVMTHSASSVVIELFHLLARRKRNFSVICTQSSPGMEGHTLATTLPGWRTDISSIRAEPAWSHWLPMPITNRSGYSETVSDRVIRPARTSVWKKCRPPNYRLRRGNGLRPGISISRPFRTTW